MNKLTHTIIVAALLLAPMQSFASVSSLETVAGLSTEIVVDSLPAESPVSLALKTPEGSTITMSLVSDASGEVRTWVAGNDLQHAGTYDISAVVGGETVRGTLTVHPDTLDTSISMIDVQRKTLDVGEEALVTVVLADRFGNPLSGRSAELISSRGGDFVDALNRETNVYGEQEFVVRAASAGDISLRAIDLISGQTLSDEAHLFAGDSMASIGGPEAIAYSAPQNFYRANPQTPYRAQLQDAQQFGGIRIEIVGQEQVATPVFQQNEPESMLLTAVDQYGNPYYDFVGNVELATTDERATLPLFGEYTFRFEDEGRKKLTLGLEFATPGIQQMIIFDPAEGIPSDPRNALGFLEVLVQEEQVVKPLTKQMSIRTPKMGTTLNTTDVTIEGSGPAFINITAEGGLEPVTGETDRQGFFSLVVPIDTSRAEQNITIFDTDAPANTAEVSFTVDVTAPEIMQVSFTPENPVEGTDVLIVATTEPGAQNVVLRINDATYDLVSTDPSSGKFQTLISAPEAGTYDAIISVSDAFGNTAENSATFPVAFRGLQPVQNVIAQSQANAIALRWDPITSDDIDAYRIYVGTSADEFLYTLDTDRPTAAATVAGLRPGTTYYFAVTALQGPRESETKGDIVSATVLGVKLETTPGDGSIFIEWSSLQQDKPLSSFLLSYGVEPDQLTEERILNGDLRAYTLRDLVNGITYYLKLTPITTTGEKLDELAADGEGTPIGGGFTAGTSDPVPYDLRGSAPSTPRPPTQAPLSQQGIPSWTFWGIFIASIGVYQWYIRHKKQQQMTTAFLSAMQTRYHQ
ncbi:MAG: fibronectin type III domain-containing protein [Candidatus Peregrinibacteria bacterium]|nr:fibronectin type III domain-containing protein [Candidatus Peregrinibacteria bacterium]MCB9808200.1 fibronectin type III domain-containing protein [Candidatus Peribacteria bacterium]